MKTTFAPSLATIGLCAALSGCTAATHLPAMSAFGPLPDGFRLSLLTGEAALEPAFLRISVIDRTRDSFKTQALPGSWGSAVVRLHATDAIAKLTRDRTITINRAGGFTGNTANSSVFVTLRPGNYFFQVTLFSGANATGTSAALHTTALALAGGTATAITMTLKTTDGADNTTGGTRLNVAVNDATGFARSAGTGLYNSVLGGPDGVPVIVAGDVILLDPLLSDSTAAGSANATAGGSTVTDVAALNPGVLSRVITTYCAASVTPTTANLEPGETILTDWVRAGNEPIRGTSWATLADTDDNGTWPARGAATRTGSGTFAGTFNWNTAPSSFTDPALFTSEAALSANYQLVYRYFDNTYDHNLIRIRTQGLAVLSPATINMTVE